MSEEFENDFGNDLISIIDDEGNEFVLEHLHTLELKGQVYMAFLPTDIDEDDEDFGLIILKVVVEDGEEILGSIDDPDELEEAYASFAEVLFNDEDEE